MRLAVLIGLMVGIVACAPAKAQDVSSPRVVRYLGLAVPFPDNPPAAPQVLKAKNIGRPASVRVWLMIDPSGKIVDIAYADDSAAYVEPFRAAFDTLHFSFTAGVSLDSPLSVPVAVECSRKTRDGWDMGVSFPVSAEQTTDSVLLREFFDANGIEPPRITEMIPIDYSLDARSEKVRYWTVTAQVSVDAEGRLQDIAYPLEGQAEMRHPVHMALMRARYTPALLRGKPFATEFLVTFRIFDNISYPFSPLDFVDTADAPLTSRYFMTYYYSDNDIFLYPIPRRPDRNILQSSKLGGVHSGSSEAMIDVDEEGKVTGVRIVHTTEKLRQIGADAARLLRWYPAIDTQGKPVKFTGRVKLEFNRSPKIVYIPEWMPR